MDVAEMVEAGQRAAALTRQLLAFSRKQTLQPRVVDLNELLRNFERMLGRLIGEDVMLELKLADDLGRVVVDPWQIEQVIMNLAVNAREAMPQGGKLLIQTSTATLDEAYARANPGTKPGNHVLMEVTDSGCGMSPDVVDHIFDPFFSTKEKGRGTGLGLSTVYGIIKQSGGNIWVESQPNRGSTFKICLPRADGSESGGPKPSALVSSDERKEHILVVEDEERLRRLMGRFLGRLGYRVTAAANGHEALALVEEKGLSPDLIISDVVMPKMSGKQMVDRLRQNRPDLKVLYMSGYTDDAIAKHGVLEPGTPLIEKPFTIEAMAQRIRQVIEGDGGDVEAS
jgi:CheY-like chemotaxis protein